MIDERIAVAPPVEDHVIMPPPGIVDQVFLAPDQQRAQMPEVPLADRGGPAGPDRKALIEAKNPAEAESVFLRAVDHAPGLPAPRVGLATALEALGKTDQAEAELAKAISELKGAAGLRERLADLQYRRGTKEAALGQLDAELKAGHAYPILRSRTAAAAAASPPRENR